jgi:hypothetical protein
MDPVSTTILAALVAGVAAGVTDVGKKVINDAYEGLKSVIKKKFGADSELANAVANLEGKRDSKGRLATLEEEVAAEQADQDADVINAVNALKEKLAQHGNERIQFMVGSEGGEQYMRSQEGKQKQDMRDSPRGKQRME